MTSLEEPIQFRNCQKLAAHKGQFLTDKNYKKKIIKFIINIKIIKNIKLIMKITIIMFIKISLRDGQHSQNLTQIAACKIINTS